MLEVKQFCSSGQQIERQFSLQEMPRVIELCREQLADATATLSLSGDVDQQGLLVVRGTVKTELSLTCQRCLKPMRFRVLSNFVVSPVTSEEEAKALPRDYEPLFVTHSELDLTRLVEDEIILAVPVTPLHDIDKCDIKQQCWSFGDQSETLEKPNPFAALAKLKK